MKGTAGAAEDSVKGTAGAAEDSVKGTAGAAAPPGIHSPAPASTTLSAIFSILVMFWETE